MQNDSNRRNFLKGSTAAAAGAALTSTIARTAHAAGSDEIKFVLIGCGGPESGPFEGNRLPAISVTDIDGQVLTPDSHRGKPVVMVFWASWCGPCRAEAPEIARMAEQYGSSIQLLSINAGETPTAARSAAKTMGVAGTIVLDQDASLQTAFRVDAIPLLVIADSDGVVRYRGNRLPSDVYRILDGLIG